MMLSLSVVVNPPRHPPPGLVSDLLGERWTKFPLVGVQYYIQSRHYRLGHLLRWPPVPEGVTDSSSEATTMSWVASTTEVRTDIEIGKTGREKEEHCRHSLHNIFHSDYLFRKGLKGREGGKGHFIEELATGTVPAGPRVYFQTSRRAPICASG